MNTEFDLRIIFEEYKNQIENEENNQIYNIKNDEYPFLLQYYQLIIMKIK